MIFLFLLIIYLFFINKEIMKHQKKCNTLMIQIFRQYIVYQKKNTKNQKPKSIKQIKTILCFCQFNINLFLALLMQKQIIKNKNQIKNNQPLLGQFLKVLKKNKNHLQSHYDRAKFQSFTKAISVSKLQERRSSSNDKRQKNQLHAEDYWNSKIKKNQLKFKKLNKNKQHKTISTQQQRQSKNPSNYTNSLLDKKLSFDLHKKSNEVVEKLVQSKSMKNHYKNNNKRYKTQFSTEPIHPIKSQSRLFQGKNSRVMSFSQMKPTDQYFANLNNIKFVQKLLLVQPSKDTSYSQHKKFYKNHKVISNHISSSRVSSRLSTSQVKMRTKLPSLVKNSKLFKQQKKYNQWRN